MPNPGPVSYCLFLLPAHSDVEFSATSLSASPLACCEYWLVWAVQASPLTLMGSTGQSPRVQLMHIVSPSYSLISPLLSGILQPQSPGMVMQMSLVAVVLPATVLTLPPNSTYVGREAQRACLSSVPATRADLATTIQPRELHSYSPCSEQSPRVPSNNWGLPSVPSFQTRPA